MSNVIKFPISRRRAHVALEWDPARSEYVVETRGTAEAAISDWSAEYAFALEMLMALGERLDLPMVDLTDGGKRHDANGN